MFDHLKVKYISGDRGVNANITTQGYHQEIDGFELNSDGDLLLLADARLTPMFCTENNDGKSGWVFISSCKVGDQPGDYRYA